MIAIRSRWMIVRRNDRQSRVQPLVLEVVAHVRNRRRPRAELDHSEAVVRHVTSRLGGPRPRLHDQDRVSTRPEPARQLVGAPAASAAHRRKGIGDEKDVHRPTLRSAASSARQCAAQL